MGDIYIAAHLRRCLRHSVFGHVLQYTPSTSVLDALHLHHAIKSPPLRYPSPLHITFIEVKNELVKMKDVFPMKVITYTVTHQRKKTDIDTHTIMYQAKSAGRHIESKMYPANFAGRYSHSIMYPVKFAGGRSRLDLLLPSFLPSREEKKKQEQKNRPLGCRGVSHTPPKHLERDEQKMQDRIFCPLRVHVVGRMQYAPTSCRQERLFPINSREGRIETKMQERKKQSINNGAELHTSHTDRVRTETKTQEQIFCPLRGDAVGRMQYAPTSCRQERLFPINSREERTETKMQKQKNRPLGSRGVLHTPPIHLGRDEKKKQEQKKRPLGSRGVLHTPHMGRVRTETKKQERIFCPLRGHLVGRMLLRPTTCRQEALFPINSLEERTETKIQYQKNRPLGCRAQKHTPLEYLGRDETKKQERRKQSIDSGAEWHTPFMRQGERDAVWRDTFLEQRARVAIWRDRCLEEKYSHARFQLSTFEENSKPYKSSLVALSEQLRDIFAA